MTLSDVVGQVGGWPIDLAGIARVLGRADVVLSAEGGRGCMRELTAREITELLRPQRGRGRPRKERR